MDEVVDFEDFTGRTDAIYSVEIRSRVTGYLEKVHFKDGDEVKEGAALFDIDDRPYRAEMNRTEAALAQSEAHLGGWRPTTSGPRTCSPAGASAGRSTTRSSATVPRRRPPSGSPTPSSTSPKLNVGYTKITAPINGRLSRRMVDPGNLVISDTTSMTTIKSQNPLYVYFDIDERTLLRLRRLHPARGRSRRYQRAEIPVMVALSDETDFPHKGLIDFRENAVDPGTGTLRARAQIDNPPPYVFTPGLFVRVRLPVGQPRQLGRLVAEKAARVGAGARNACTSSPTRR